MTTNFSYFLNKNEYLIIRSNPEAWNHGAHKGGTLASCPPQPALFVNSNCPNFLEIKGPSRKPNVRKGQACPG